MKIASILENQKIEKRIAITPEIAKKYSAIGIEVALSKNYGLHLGIKDEEYIDVGAKILKEDNEIISGADLIVQLGLMSDEKNLLIKENQTIVGILDPYNNKDTIDNLKKKKYKYFFFRVAPKNY